MSSGPGWVERRLLALVRGRRRCRKSRRGRHGATTTSGAALVPSRMSASLRLRQQLDPRDAVAPDVGDEQPARPRLHRQPGGHGAQLCRDAAGSAVMVRQASRAGTQRHGPPHPPPRCRRAAGLSRRTPGHRRPRAAAPGARLRPPGMIHHQDFVRAVAAVQHRREAPARMHRHVDREIAQLDLLSRPAAATIGWAAAPSRRAAGRARGLEHCRRPNREGRTRRLGADTGGPHAGQQAERIS